MNTVKYTEFKTGSLRVLFISSGNSSYGIVPFIKSQGESLRDVGIDLDFLTINGKGIIGYLKYVKVIRTEAKKYDIVHTHYGLMGFLCLLAMIKNPIVLSIMGSDIYGIYDQKGKRKFKSYFYMFLTQIALVRANKIIAKSPNILNYIPYKRKSIIIPNGVDFERFKPMDQMNCRKLLNLNIDKKIVLFLGNPNDPRKNFTLLLDSIKYADNQNVTFVNPYPIKQEEFVKYLCASDVFVLTSYNEGSPNVIKEAMACNVPIVSTNVGDVLYVIKETKGCYICKFDPLDLANQINLALNFKQRTTGRKDIEHLDSKKIAKKIKRIYMELKE